VESTGVGWVLLLHLDGESRAITLQRLEGVALFWQEFVRKYLADHPITRRVCPEVRQSGEWRVYFVDASCKQG
jgi:hypothetical protein